MTTAPVVWVTRAEPGAAATAGRLTALGYVALVDPLLEIAPVAAAPDMADAAGLVFTSANGVRAFARLNARRDGPVFAVGTATAEAARAAGFRDVSATPGGDAAALAERLGALGAGPLLWPRGRDVALDLTRALAGRIEVRPLVVYSAQPRRPAEAIGQARAGRIAAVLLHSPRGARQLARLEAPPPPAVCLSPAVAQALDHPAAAVAETPDEAALLDALGKVVPPV